MIRLWNTLKWLFNHPPVSITQAESLKCKFCGKTANVWEVRGTSYCACWDCVDQVMTKVLTPKK